MADSIVGNQVVNGRMDGIARVATAMRSRLEKLCAKEREDAGDGGELVHENQTLRLHFHQPPALACSLNCWYPVRCYVANEFGLFRRADFTTAAELALNVSLFGSDSKQLQVAIRPAGGEPCSSDGLPLDETCKSSFEYCISLSDSTGEKAKARAAREQTQGSSMSVALVMKIKGVQSGGAADSGTSRLHAVLPIASLPIRVTHRVQDDGGGVPNAAGSGGNSEAASGSNSNATAMVATAAADNATAAAIATLGVSNCRLISVDNVHVDNSVDNAHDDLEAKGSDVGRAAAAANPTTLLVAESPGQLGIGGKVWDSSLVLLEYLSKEGNTRAFLGVGESRSGEFERLKAQVFEGSGSGSASSCDDGGVGGDNGGRSGGSSDVGIRRKRCIELGSGTGLVGIYTALIGADMMVTDMNEVVPLIQYNLEMNLLLQRGDACGNAGDPSAPAAAAAAAAAVGGTGGATTAAGAGAAGKAGGKAGTLLWGSVEDATALKPPFDTIVMSDVVYDPCGYSPLVQSLLHLTHSPREDGDGDGSSGEEGADEPLIILAHRHRHPDDHLFFDELEQHFHVHDTKFVSKNQSQGQDVRMLHITRL
jgi:hypothetical protein